MQFPFSKGIQGCSLGTLLFLCQGLVQMVLLCVRSRLGVSHPFHLRSHSRGQGDLHGSDQVRAGSIGGSLCLGETHQEEVWIDALPTKANINWFLVSPNLSCFEGRCIPRKLSTCWIEKGLLVSLERKGKKSRTEAEVARKTSGSSSSKSAGMPSLSQSSLALSLSGALEATQGSNLPWVIRTPLVQPTSFFIPNGAPICHPVGRWRANHGP